MNDQVDIGNGPSTNNPTEGSAQQNWQGVQVEITPQQQQIPDLSNITLKKVTVPKKKKVPTTLIGILALVIAIVAVGGIYEMHGVAKTSSSSTTTIKYIPISNFSSCETFDKPGTYYLSNNIVFNSIYGTCIDITSDNVKLICNKNNIIGKGPYSSSPPYSYGILINGKSNVSVYGCQISNFSFGIFITNSSHINITNNNLTSDFMSGIVLENSSNANVSTNFISKSLSTLGAIYIGKNSSGNKFLQNTLFYNSQYGFNISSTGNRFVNNSVTQTPISFLCSGIYGFKDSNNAKGNFCYNNTGCSFINCMGKNSQVNLNALTLSNNISYCGVISKPGTYVLQGNIDMGTLVNTSAISSPCLMINTSNVTLNCNNFKISNGTIGIEEKSASNITLENCNIYNFHTGVLLSGISNSSILNLNVNYGGTQNKFIPGQSGGIVGININKMLFSNITVKNSITGMILENSANSTLQNINIFNNIIGGLMLESANFDVVSNLIANYNKYGISMQNTFATTIKGFEFKNNTYGTYLSESFGNVFLNGYAMNNSDGDIYATPDSANTSDNQIIKTTCGLTDAYWAQRYCQAFVVPGLNYKPVINCTSITRPGIYKLTTDLNKVTASCMYIKSNNVVFDCGSHKIFGNGYGTAITANGDNITISNCTISNFATGIWLNNAFYMNIFSNKVNITAVGINVTNSKNLTLLNNQVSYPSVYGIALQNSSNTELYQDSVNYGGKGSAGIYLYNSTLNTIINNTANSANIGIEFAGNSTQNYVIQNFMQGTNYDYFCQAPDSPIDAENGGINYGISKLGCKWLAALSTVSPSIPCASVQTPGTYSLSADYIYNYGDMCYNIHANGTTINCNGHTIIATNGGIFADIINAQNFKVENCYLKGFTSPIVANGSSGSILNNTIYINKSELLPAVAINLSNAKTFDIEYNKIFAPFSGIFVSNTFTGKLIGNNVTSFVYPYKMINANNASVIGNIASYYGALGFLLSNSTNDLFKNNNFSGVYSLLCLGTAKGATANVDQGNNFCKANMNCTWIKSSLVTCPQK
ncbi:MAG: NosD domain-containing protein [Candidatus Micrarchaeia archaeon]